MDERTGKREMKARTRAPRRSPWACSSWQREQRVPSLGSTVSEHQIWVRSEGLGAGSWGGRDTGRRGGRGRRWRRGARWRGLCCAPGPPRHGDGRWGWLGLPAPIPSVSSGFSMSPCWGRLIEEACLASTSHVLCEWGLREQPQGTLPSPLGFQND